MSRFERTIIVLSVLLIAISAFLFSLKGRYQYADFCSHDTWTGKIYRGGTKLIDNKSVDKVEEQNLFDK